MPFKNHLLTKLLIYLIKVMWTLWNPPHAQWPWTQGRNSWDVCQLCPHICKVSWRRLNTASAKALWSILSPKAARILVTLHLQQGHIQLINSNKDVCNIWKSITKVINAVLVNLFQESWKKKVLQFPQKDYNDDDNRYDIP